MQPSDYKATAEAEEGTMQISEPHSSSRIRQKSNDISFTILWSPLPPITAIIPFIGHTGIGDSHGIASDFRGPYYVGDDGRMAFGSPTRAVKIDIGQLPGGAERWDACIAAANEEYSQRMHNICCDNCHSHVAYALNMMPIKPPIGSKWNMVSVCFYLLVKGRFLSWTGVLLQFGPFLVLLMIYLLIKAFH